MARSKALTRAEDITPVILVLRGSRVILDRDLAHDLRRHNQAPERAGEAQRRALSPGLHKRASAREFRVILLCPTVLFGAQMAATPSRPADP